MVSSLCRSEWKNGLPEIWTDRLHLRLARRDEVSKIVRFLVRNREHTRRWEPSHPDSYFTEAAWLGVPSMQHEDARRGLCYRFRALLTGGDGEFVAHGILRDIARGDLQCCSLGYTVDCGHTGKGIATEMAAALVRFAFDQLDLHRIEACYMPANLASARVLEKVGFATEGTLRKSLYVNGRWEDHVITSILNGSWCRRFP